MDLKFRTGLIIGLSMLIFLILGTEAICEQKGFGLKPGNPNIIYILVDDLGYGDVNLNVKNIKEFANPHIKTPNLARLAQESMVFRHHYSASPVCSPSRAGLLTGRTPTRQNINLYISDNEDNDKVFLSGNEITIAEILKGTGYETAIFGKWHLNGADWEDKESWKGWTGSFPKQQGFDHGFISKENPHYTRLLVQNTQKHPGDYFTVDGEPLGAIKGYTSDIITQAAVKWMKEERDSSRPFFLYLPYDAVHVRISTADKFEEMYHTGDARKDAYYGNISQLDAAIGNLLDTLVEMGLAENTIIFFSSDNGPEIFKKSHNKYFSYGTSYPLSGQKYQLYEGGIRVPGMIRWPNRIQPGVSNEPNSTLDLLPTLCEIVGVQPPEDREMDGTSMLPHLLDRTPIHREKPLYWQFEHALEYNHSGEQYNRRLFGGGKKGKKTYSVSIREGDYVLRGKQEEKFRLPVEFVLYDLVKDPEERQDLSDLRPDLLRELKNKLEEMYKSVNADREQTKSLIK